MSRLAIVLAASLMFMTCASRSFTAGGGVQPNRLTTGPCGGGKGTENRNAPIVCVDDGGETLSVNPDPVFAFDVGASGGRPVVIQWFTTSGGGNLRIDMKSAECVTAMSCNGRGKCTARTIPFKPGETGEKRCKYDVLTDTHPPLDPDTVIVKCCPPPEPEP